MYKKLAEYYDNYVGIDYQVYENILKKIVKKSDTCLDLACGSGNLVSILNKYANYVIGSDVSSEMLARAKDKNPYNDFFIHDLRDDFFIEDLNIITCTVDSINYLLKKNEVKKLFKNVYNNLQVGGYFLFDIYAYNKLKTMSDYAYHEVHENYSFIWDSYVTKEKIDNYLTFYVDENNIIKRYDEVHHQRVYQKEYIVSLLKNYRIKETCTEDRIIYLCKKYK